jgi:hypothetical protein
MELNCRTLSLVAYFLTVVLLTSIIYHSGSWPLKLHTFVKIAESLWRLLTKWQLSEDFSKKRLVSETFWPTSKCHS